MTKKAFYVINGITLYRIIAAPGLFYLLVINHLKLFSIFLVISFFTDLIDGFLARKYKVTSIFGTRLDSIGDDLTVLMAVIGMVMYKSDFLIEQKWVFATLLFLFLVQIVFSLIKYFKLTSFHTYLAKLGALAQGLFFIHIFFSTQPNYPLFFFAAIITGLDLIEEIILVYVLPAWTVNVKSIFLLKKQKSN